MSTGSHLLGEGVSFLPQHVGDLEGALAWILHDLRRAFRDVDHLEIYIRPSYIYEGGELYIGL